jgi:outer membrane protein assembly factor BamB
MYKKIIPILLLLLLIPTAIIQITAQVNENNWQHPAFDRTNTGFSPQTQINKDNIQDLELKWIFQVPGYWGDAGGMPGEVIEGGDGHGHGDKECIREDRDKAADDEELHECFNFEIPHVPTGVQTVPLVVNGIVYIASEFNVLYALKAADSQLLWRFAAPIGSFDEKNWWSKVFAQHGIDYFDDKVWMQSSDCTIYGLEPLTGEVLVTIPDTCKDIPGNTGIYFASFAPIEYNNLLITRPTGGGGFTGERGFIAAYDKNTGELVWRWETIPPTGNEENWGAELIPKGNLDAYPNDWGKCEEHEEDEHVEGFHNCNWIGGGSVWTLIALDEEAGDIFFTTNAPTPDIDGYLRPGPNLFTSSVVSLKASTGEMNWYYQIVTHDIYYHESRWSTILAEIESGGSTQKAVIVGSKTNLVHVLDAKTGEPIYQSIRVGPPPVNTQQADMGNNADMELSQRDLIRQQVCPGFQGGIDAAPAFAHNTIYVVTQTFCTSYVEESGVPYKDGNVNIFHHIAGPAYFDSFHTGNSSLYAIDASNGRVKWVYEMQNRNQYGAVTTTGGMVLVPDRSGDIHAVDEETGQLLRIFSTGGLGGAGVSVGSNAYGEMMLFITSGGAGEFGQRTTGILAAYGFGEAVDSSTDSQFSPDLLTIISLGIAVIAVGYSVYISRRH